MAGSGKPTTGSDQSLGDLVALATRDLSQLVRYEIDLAKSELRGDLRRIAIGGALFGVAAFFGLGILVALFFAYAYMLHEVAHAPGGMASAYVLTAATVLLVAVVAGFVAWRLIRRMSGMKRTRESVTEGFGVLRRKSADGKMDSREAVNDGTAASLKLRSADPANAPSTDGQRTAIADPTPPR